MIIFVNKWDTTERTDTLRRDLQTIAENIMPKLAYFPFIFGSALERHHIGQLFSLIPTVIDHGRHRISTAALNTFVKTHLSTNPPTAKYGKSAKIYYMTQAEISPPTFVLFVNHTTRITPVYQRFIERRIREHLFPFIGSEIRLVVKSHRPEV